MWTEELNWPRVCKKKSIHVLLVMDLQNGKFNKTNQFFRQISSDDPGCQKIQLRIPKPTEWPEFVHIFFNKDFLQQEVNHCLQTNRHHPYCICAFLNESFAISKVYHYTITPMLGCCGPNSSFTIELLRSEPHRRFLSAIQCSLTKTFICWPPL